jgi:hypothetical protein
MNQGGHFGMAFPATRGVTHWGIVSRTISNITLDTTIQLWLTHNLENVSGLEGLVR